jgi:Tn3 transposase DDE domain
MVFSFSISLGASLSMWTTSRSVRTLRFWRARQNQCKRFTRSNFQHPTYQALTELGQAIKTLFLCQYFHEEASRRKIHDGLQVIEN